MTFANRHERIVDLHLKQSPKIDCCIISPPLGELREQQLNFVKSLRRNEILSSINFVFVNATEGTCGFHVVNMGWKKNVPSCHQILTPSQLKKWTLVKRQIHSWVYSWMNPGNVEDKDEYQVSKCLLKKIICSRAVFGSSGQHMFIIVKILKFLGPPPTTAPTSPTLSSLAPPPCLRQ